VLERRHLEGFEQGMFLASRRTPLNLIVWVGLGGPSLDPVLARALGWLQRRHPLLRSRITAGRRASFEVMDPEEIAAIPLEIRADGIEGACRVIDRELNTGFEVGAGPLARVAYVKGPPDRLILTLFHSIADAASAGSLVDDLLEACQAELSDRSPKPSGPLALAPGLSSLRPGHHRGWRGARAVLAYAGYELAGERRFRGDWRAVGQQVPPPGRAGTHMLDLTQEETSALIAWSRRRRLTLTSVLNAALLMQACQNIHGGHPCLMRALVWVDLRPHLSPSPPPDALGCYASMLRVLAAVDGGADLGRLAREVQDITEQRARRGDRFAAAGLSPVLTRVMLHPSTQRLGTTALSYGGGHAVRQQYGPIAVEELRAFIPNNPHGAEIALAAGVFRASLWCNLLHVQSELSEETVRAIAAGLGTTLKEASSRE
jgi:hypothetical protein